MYNGNQKKAHSMCQCILFRGVCLKLFTNLLLYALFSKLITEKLKENYFMSHAKRKCRNSSNSNQLGSPRNFKTRNTTAVFQIKKDLRVPPLTINTPHTYPATSHCMNRIKRI